MYGDVEGNAGGQSLVLPLKATFYTLYFLNKFFIFLKRLNEAKKVVIAIRKYNWRVIGWNAALTALYKLNLLYTSLKDKNPPTNIKQNSDMGIITVNK